MLKIQEFCAFFPNDWKERLAADPYNLTIKEEGNLVLFKYSQIDSDFNEPICREARGIILEKGTWRVVRKAFDKFFNVGEKWAAQIDWESASATQKEDGSLISLYYYNDQWNVATNSTIDARNAGIESPYKNFLDLFICAVRAYKLDFSLLDKNCTYTLELCSPYTQIVVKYDTIQLFHTVTINNETLEEVNHNIGIPKPAYYKFNSEKEYKEFVENLPSNTEGIVVKDKFNNRVKIKTEKYFAFHKIANNGHINLEYALDLVRKNDYHEFLSYFPIWTDYFNFVIAKYEAAAQNMEKIYSDLTPFRLTNSSRKEVALTFKDNPLFSAYMIAWDGKLKAYFNAATTKDFIKIFRISDKEYTPS